MSINVVDFFRLDSGIGQLKAAKSHLEDIQKETEAAIQTKLTAAKETVEAKKQEAATAKAGVEEFVEAKKAETQAAVEEWKANCNRKKLEKRAERAANHAEACVVVALCSAEEADVAILEAVAAQKDAEGVA